MVEGRNIDNAENGNCGLSTSSDVSLQTEYVPEKMALATSGICARHYHRGFLHGKGMEHNLLVSSVLYAMMTGELAAEECQVALIADFLEKGWLRSQHTTPTFVHLNDGILRRYNLLKDTGEYNLPKKSTVTANLKVLES